MGSDEIEITILYSSFGLFMWEIEQDFKTTWTKLE